MVKLVIFILLLVNINLLSSSDIDFKIRQIQNSSPEDRYRLMNAFKRELRTMNRDSRIQAIQLLQAKQSTNYNTIQNNVENNLENIQSISKQITDRTYKINNNSININDTIKNISTDLPSDNTDIDVVKDIPTDLILDTTPSNIVDDLPFNDNIKETTTVDLPLDIIPDDVTESSSSSIIIDLPLDIIPDDVTESSSSSVSSNTENIGRF